MVWLCTALPWIVAPMFGGAGGEGADDSNKQSNKKPQPHPLTTNQLLLYPLTHILQPLPIKALVPASTPCCTHPLSAGSRPRPLPRPLPQRSVLGPTPSANTPTWPAATADDHDPDATPFGTRRRRRFSQATRRPPPWQSPTERPPATGKPSGRRGSTGG
jgi:hypothetical protein